MTPYDPNNPQNPQHPEQQGHGQPPHYPTPQQPMYPPQPGQEQPMYPPQPGHGQPMYPPPPGYEQPGYPPTQPGYGQPGYPSQQMGYGQPGYPSQQMSGQPMYPQPGYPGAPQPPRRSRAGMIAGIIAAVLGLCVLACAGGLFALGRIGQGAASNILTTLAPTETALAQELTPSPSATILYQDSLTDTPDGWPNDSRCAFKADGYHVHGGISCFGPDASTAADANVSVTVAPLTTGQNTSYGIVFRHTSSGNFYSFEITPDGQWCFVKFVGGKSTMVAQCQSNSAIQTGNVSNDLEVDAVGSQFSFYINGQPVGVANDSTYATGSVGVGNDDSSKTSEVVFTNFTIAQPQP